MSDRAGGVNLEAWQVINLVGAPLLALLFMAPVIAVFFAAQKVFIEGVTLSGVKG